MTSRCTVAAASAKIHGRAEPRVLSGHRRRLLSRASGRVLDVSPGWARNVVCLSPKSIESVTVAARDTSQFPSVPGLPAPVALDPATGRGAFDTVVSVLSLCTAEHPVEALQSLGSWLAPGGRILMLEHVAGPHVTERGLAWVGKALGAVCNLELDLTATLVAAGMVSSDRAVFNLAPAPMLLPCMATVARASTTRRPAA